MEHIGVCLPFKAKVFVDSFKSEIGENPGCLGSLGVGN